MQQRRPFGSVFRRRRRRRGRDGARRTGYYPGSYVRYRRNGREVTRYPGEDRAAAEAQLKHPRHLAAINLIRCGVDLPAIQAHLSHKPLISTLRYAAYADRTASARGAKALDRLFGEPEP